MSKAMVVFSGGQDSTTCLALAREGVKDGEYEGVIAISFMYEQKHATAELNAARQIVREWDIPHKLVYLNIPSVSALLTRNGRYVADVNGPHPQHPDLPASFVPDRNAYFLLIAHMNAQVYGCDTIMAGMNQTDYSGYPDCREEFLVPYMNALNIGSGTNIKAKFPLLHKSKAEIWKMAFDLGVYRTIVYETHTCYNGETTSLHAWGFGCGECPACVIRRESWEQFMKDIGGDINAKIRG